MEERIKIALLDGNEFHLFWADKDGEFIEDIDWLSHWSTDFVSCEFVKLEGFQVEVA